MQDRGKEREKKFFIFSQNLINFNLKTKSLKIECNLHDACRKGDFELIKIYLSKTIENDSESLKFKIDETNRTASLFKLSGHYEEIIIPRTVEHESVEYLITSICGTTDKNNEFE